LTAAPPSGARAPLGLWTSTSLAVGNMVGSGIFLLPASLAPYGGLGIAGWLLTSLGALLLALVFARLSRRIPKAGGPYAYARAAFGDFAGFFMAWGYWISILATNAAIAVALVSYLTVFWPAPARVTGLAPAVALGVIWLLTAVNAAGVRYGGVAQLVTTVIKLIPLAALATLGLVHADLTRLAAPPTTGGTQAAALAATVTLTLWAFLGLESATIPAESVVHPDRTIPRATLLGTGLTAIVYILSTAAVMGIVPAARLAESTAPFADAGRAIWGGWAGYLMGAGAVISCFGALNGWILLSGQLPLAMARDGLFPTLFGTVRPDGTPAAGIAVSSVLVTVLLLLNYTAGLVEVFTKIILLATLTAVVPFVFATMAELTLVLRSAPPRGTGRRWRAGLLAAAAYGYSMWAVIGAGRETVFWGFVLLLAGLPLYVWLRRPRGEP
jgi:APA family basic amino acid/polyamine antiporter